MENDPSKGKPLPPKKQSRRKRIQDRRRANLGRGPGGIDRRKNPGDRRQYLGDRRGRPKFPPTPKLEEYKLHVDESEDWEKWLREQSGQNPPA